MWNAICWMLAIVWIGRTFILMTQGHRDAYAYLWPFIDGFRLARRGWHAWRMRVRA